MTSNIRHLALILDGNGRWAGNRGLDRSAGHAAGAIRAREVIEHCARIGVPHLSMFTFSRDNWKRPRNEVQFIFSAVEQELIINREMFLHYGISLKFVGDLSELPPSTQSLCRETELETAHGKSMTLVLALNYSGTWDLNQAARQFSRFGGTFESHLSTRGLPPVDLLIRTGGETRLSDFYLWQVAYAEILFEKALWPDFTPQHLQKMLERFRYIQRRFGQTPEQCAAEPDSFRRYS